MSVSQLLREFWRYANERHRKAACTGGAHRVTHGSSVASDVQPVCAVAFLNSQTHRNSFDPVRSRARFHASALDLLLSDSEFLDQKSQRRVVARSLNRGWTLVLGCQIIAYIGMGRPYRWTKVLHAQSEFTERSKSASTTDSKHSRCSPTG
jgi:hypothetical protein